MVDSFQSRLPRNPNQNLMDRLDKTRKELSRAVHLIRDLVENPNDPFHKTEATKLLAKYKMASTSAERELFQRVADLYDADPLWHDQTIVVERRLRGRTIRSRYRIIGIDPERPKNKIRVVNSKGNPSHVSVEECARQLGRSAKGARHRRRAHDRDLDFEFLEGGED